MGFEVGDTVIWTDAESSYAKWFYSQIGVIKSINNGHCRVSWLFPVKYFGMYTKGSDFPLAHFSKPQMKN